MTRTLDFGKAPAVRSLEAALSAQAGVVSWAQWKQLGLTKSQLRTRLSHGWRRVVRGVYVNHSGPLTVLQCHWIAVLAHWPAAISHWSALPGLRAVGDPGLVHVAVPNARVHRPVEGVLLHEMLGFADRVRWRAHPPQILRPHALLDVMRDHRIDEGGMVSHLCAAIRLNLVTPSAVRGAMEVRAKVRGRLWLEGVLDDLAHGTESVLEFRFVERVERAHGLPAPIRQHESRDAVTGRTIRRDAYWPKFGLSAELDGWQFHQHERRQADLKRDLAAAAHEDVLTVRLDWQQVMVEACSTAASLARIMQRRGWEGTMTRCPQCP